MSCSVRCIQEIQECFRSQSRSVSSSCWPVSQAQPAEPTSRAVRRTPEASAEAASVPPAPAPTSAAQDTEAVITPSATTGSAPAPGGRVADGAAASVALETERVKATPAAPRQAAAVGTRAGGPFIIWSRRRATPAAPSNTPAPVPAPTPAADPAPARPEPPAAADPTPVEPPRAEPPPRGTASSSSSKCPRRR